MSGYRSPWAVLGIRETDDERAVKRAYSAKLKEMDVENDPQGFIALREAFEQARNIASWRAEQKAEAERRKLERGDDAETETSIDDWDDEDWADEHWGDDWDGGTPSTAYTNESGGRVDAGDGQSQSQPQSTPKIDGIDVDLASVAILAASPYLVPSLAHADSGTVSIKPAPQADDNAPAFDAIAADMSFSEATSKDGAVLGLPTQPLAEIFPDQTPLYGSFFGFGPRTKTPPPSDAPLDAFAHLEEHEPTANQAPEPAEQPQPHVADDIDGGSGYVSFTRDDWGNADRERIAQLLYDKHYGPAEAGEVERLGKRLFASPHMEEIDYRDWMENWLAALIAETSPRSDGLLGMASQTFGWGTDADKLYHSYDVSRCVARNRDLDAIRQMQEPGNRWHNTYKLLQEGAPYKIAWTDQSKWKEVQDFIDNVRAHRPTVEWDLNAQHVTLWDELIDAKRGGERHQNTSTYENQGFKWYHGLFLAFWALMLLGRCAGPDTENDYNRSANTEYAKVIDYDDLFRLTDNKKALEYRRSLADAFNAKLHDPKNSLHATASAFPAEFDLSRYVQTADLEAVTGDACSLDCEARIKAQLETVAAGTTKVGDMSVQPSPQVQTKLTDEQIDTAVTDLRMGDYPDLPKNMSNEDRERLLLRLKEAKSVASPAADTTIDVPMKWSFIPSDPKSTPQVQYNSGMKKLGFTRQDIADLERSLVRKKRANGKVDWQCMTKCDAIIAAVLKREAANPD